MSPRQRSGWKPGPHPFNSRAIVWSWTSHGWYRVGGGDNYELAVADAAERMKRVRGGVAPTQKFPKGITAHPDARFVATWEDQEPDDAWRELQARQATGGDER
jgi:hypothetical protein